MTTFLGKNVRSDRTVHASYPGMEIVRYDRAGKWYLEPSDPSLRRQHVTIDRAVSAALWARANGGKVFTGLPGAKAFDSRFQKAVSKYG